MIMAERDKTEMESEVSKHEFDLQGSRIICRSGRPLPPLHQAQYCMIASQSWSGVGTHTVLHD